MRFVPAGTSTAWPLIVSLGTRDRFAGRGRGDSPGARAFNQRLELRAELLDVGDIGPDGAIVEGADRRAGAAARDVQDRVEVVLLPTPLHDPADQDRKSTRLNSSHLVISYAVFCLKKKKKKVS